MNVLDIVRALVTGDAATLNSTKWQEEALAVLDQAAGESSPGASPAADEPEGQGDELDGQADELDGQAPDSESAVAVEAGREETSS